MRKLLAIICALNLLCSNTAFAEVAPETAIIAGEAIAADEVTSGDPAPPEMPGDGVPDGQTPPDKPDGGNGFGGSGTVTQGMAANVIDTDALINGGTYSSSADNENALRVIGNAGVILSGVTVEKIGGTTSNTEDSDFYGQNAGLLATDGATLTITESTVTTDASGGNAIFSYGQGTTITAIDSTVRTTMNNSGGIHVTGGGTLFAENLDVETQSNSAASIRSDRGGGTLVVDGGSYVTNGTGSPTIYSTAEITVKNAVLDAHSSEAIVVEGKNSVALENCAVTGNMMAQQTEDSGENIHNVMIYQSMSGDADVGQSHFSMTGGSLTSLNGDMFYITNTSCTVYLNGVALGYANDNLMQVVGNNNSRGWGTVGENGGQCQFVAEGQQMQGNITVDEISTLDMSVVSGSHFTGAVNPNGTAGVVNVTLDAQSTWTLTADSYITSFDGDLESVLQGDYTLYINGVAAQ